MPKLTRLDYIQKALIALNEQEVSATGETVESDMVASILDDVYEKLIDLYPWPHLYDFLTLEVTSVANKMKIPDSVSTIEFVRYNKKDIVYLSPYEMKKLLDGRDTTLSTVDSLGAINNADPKYWSSFNDEYIIFDSYDDQLVSALSEIYCVKKPNKITLDTDYPDIPTRMQQVLLDGLISAAFIQIKADPQMGAFYLREYKNGVIRLKRWASSFNMESTTYGRDYGRKNLS